MIAACCGWQAAHQCLEAHLVMGLLLRIDLTIAKKCSDLERQKSNAQKALH
jgi:hypothetical protein